MLISLAIKIMLIYNIFSHFPLASFTTMHYNNNKRTPVFDDSTNSLAGAKGVWNMEIMGIIFAAMIYLTILSIVIGWIVYAYYKIKCGKKHKCQNDKCPFRAYCDRTALSDAERERFQRLLDEYKEKLP